MSAAGGVDRSLAIPTPVDRALQRTVLDRIAPVFELFFEQSSLAYRRGLGRHRAADRIRSLFENGFRYALRS